MLIKELGKKLQDIIIKNSKLEQQNITINEESDLIDELGFDSLLMVQLIVDVEEEFNFEFDYEKLDMNDLRKFSVLREYVISKVKDSV